VTTRGRSRSGASLRWPCAQAREDEVVERPPVLVDGVLPAEVDAPDPCSFGGTEEEQRRVARVDVPEIAALDAVRDAFGENREPGSLRVRQLGPERVVELDGPTTTAAAAATYR
jgi:hypothetical protein